MALWAPEVERAICMTCDGRCCADKEIFVVLDREEAERRLHEYRYERKGIGLSPSRYPVLKKRKDGSCVYFDRETKKCGIYARRPAGCRAWFCGKGTRHNWVWRSLKDK